VEKHRQTTKAESKIALKLEVPGMKQEDLDVRMESDLFTVRGERKFEKEENFHWIERCYGTFYRAFTLPTIVDTANVKASYDSGVLKLEMAKKAEAKPKQIKIGVNASAPENRTVEAAKSAV